ncbi:MAG TPA: hypothetical protein PK349_08905 [Candidatus Hydrogenedentes bacterium]|nr:hypothetical protein [Candidatus Hydrogenedentota bacterium]
MRVYDLLIIPPVLALIYLIWVVARSIFTSWLEYRIRLALLQRAEQHPELLQLLEDVPDNGLLANATSPETAQDTRQQIDLTLTGVSLTVIGLVFVIFNGMLGRSQWAVGAYFGGVACVVIGFLLATLGILLHFLERPPAPPR